MNVLQSQISRILFLVVLVSVYGCNKSSTDLEEGDLEFGAVGEAVVIHEDNGNGMITLDLSGSGVPGLIDVPKGTEVDVVIDPHGTGDTSGKTTEIYLQNGSFFYVLMRRTLPFMDSIENLQEHVLGIDIDAETKINPDGVEIVDDQVVIYHISKKETPAPNEAVYNLFAIVRLGDVDYLCDNWDGESCTREQIELMSESIRSLRPKDESAE